ALRHLHATVSRATAKNSRRAGLSDVPAGRFTGHGDLLDYLRGAAHVGTLQRLRRQTAVGYADRARDFGVVDGKYLLARAFDDRLRGRNWPLVTHSGRPSHHRSMETTHPAGRETSGAVVGGPGRALAGDAACRRHHTG